MKRPGHRKHIPQRTCIACRTMRPKRELIRIVRTSDGKVVIDDERGKRSGRGAYLCACQPCWNQALERKRLDAALRISIDATTAAKLQAYAQNLPEQLSEEDVPGGSS